MNTGNEIKRGKEYSLEAAKPSAILFGDNQRTSSEKHVTGNKSGLTTSMVVDKSETRNSGAASFSTSDTQNTRIYLDAGKSVTFVSVSSSAKGCGHDHTKLC